MNFKRLLAVLALLLAFGLTSTLDAQTGARKREHRNQRGGGFHLFKRKKSTGHADAFAANKRNKGFFARILHPGKKNSGWAYRRTNQGARQNREQAKLFSRERTKGKRYREGMLAKQNKRRSGSRSRGNETFAKKKR